MPCEKAVEYLTRAMREDWGNPSSLHGLGITAESAVSAARVSAAEQIGALAQEIVFTSGGTEANNTAILSALSAKKRGGKVITTTIEHPSVLETVKRLEGEGLRVVRLSPDNSGVVPLSSLEAALTDDTVLVSMMMVNNETGAQQPVEQAAKLVKRLAPAARFHCDAVQAFGKLPVNVRRLGVDLLSVSSHKIHGPKGIGFLYVKKGAHLSPLLTGGGQERGMRSGTEPVELIRGLQGAIESLPEPNRQLKEQAALAAFARQALLATGFTEINSP